MQYENDPETLFQRAFLVPYNAKKMKKLVEQQKQETRVELIHFIRRS